MADAIDECEATFRFIKEIHNCPDLWDISSPVYKRTVAQKGHTCKLKMLLQTKNLTCKLKMLLQIKNSTCKLKFVHANKRYYLQVKYSTCKLETVLQMSLQIKNEKSCVRSMSDDDLVRNVRPGLTAVRPFMFHVCNIFSLHVQFLICMYYF